MNEMVESPEVAPASGDSGSVELGKWLGRRETFALIAGRCSADEVESLRRIRDSKMYTKLSGTWEEFCSGVVHAPCRTIERDIAYLRRFGPSFFTLRQLVRISVREYAQIAAQISAEGVHLDGEVVALLPENSEQLAAALDTLLQRNQASAPPPPLPPPAFDAVLHRLETAAESLRAYEGKPSREQMQALARGLTAMLNGAVALGLTLTAG